jgi:hypothetical protein
MVSLQLNLRLRSFTVGAEESFPFTVIGFGGTHPSRRAGPWRAAFSYYCAARVRIRRLSAICLTTRFRTTSARVWIGVRMFTTERARRHGRKSPNDFPLSIPNLSNAADKVS